jgi:hypothetical protein
MPLGMLVVVIFFHPLSVIPPTRIVMIVVRGHFHLGQKSARGIVGRMPFRQDPVRIYVDAKTRLLLPLIGRHLLDRPEGNKSWGLYIGGEGIVELLGYTTPPSPPLIAFPCGPRVGMAGTEENGLTSADLAAVVEKPVRSATEHRNRFRRGQAQ